MHDCIRHTRRNVAGGSTAVVLLALIAALLGYIALRPAETKIQQDLAPYEEELESLYRDYGDRICCLITEPYLGGGGSFHPQKEYIQLLESFCRRHDILFMLDEIQANFGRTGSMYAFSQSLVHLKR